MLIVLALGCTSSFQALRSPPAHDGGGLIPDQPGTEGSQIGGDSQAAFACLETGGCGDTGPGGAHIGSDSGLSTGEPTPCPPDMVHVEEQFCIDRYEAPNQEGSQPLVMFHYGESQDWCAHRGKRLCFDDEWERACAGPSDMPYPYGADHLPGTCNDEEIWRVYDGPVLQGWPADASQPGVASLDELIDRARASSTTGALAADEVMSLYQAEGCGDNAGCGGHYGVFDLTGNVEEWTTRRDGGAPSFHGNLKGRFWAEARTCQSDLTSHGDYFRFYEIGFRCCAVPSEPG